MLLGSGAGGNGELRKKTGGQIVKKRRGNAMYPECDRSQKEPTPERGKENREKVPSPSDSSQRKKKKRTVIYRPPGQQRKEKIEE